MKKTILLFSLFFFFNSSHAELIKTSMLDYVPTSRDFVFEVLTHKFDNVTLDCASFITGLVFYNNKKELYNFYLDGDACEVMHEFLLDSKINQMPVCLEIESEQHKLTISRKDKEECE